VADELGVPLAQMAIAWILKNPNVSSVITGASKLEQVKENMKAMDVVAQMTPDVMESIRVVLED
jgi:aryl-alcohol dehydrogenase-like predicted oxidoreductase